MELLWCGLFKHGLEDDVKKVIIDMMEKVDVCEVPPAESLSAKRHRTGLFDFLNKAENCASPRINQPVTSKARQSSSAELENYLDCEVSTSDPLQFWRENQSRFPRLYQIARQTFCAPGSTAAVERIFSIAGYILSQRRTRLTDNNFQNQLLANVNYDLPEFPCKKLRLE